METNVCGRMVQMVAADGHKLSSYEAVPAGEVRGGVVVLQEIFGVTNAIRAVCDDLAAQGYRANKADWLNPRSRSREP